MLSFLFRKTVPRIPNKTTDLMQNAYNPTDKEQHELILQEINKFKEKQQKLLDMDKLLGISSGVTTLLWFGGYVSLSVSILSYFLIYSASQRFDRELHAKNFMEQLNRLLQIYHWCNKSNPNTTEDPLFLSILELIAPYVQDAENVLIPSELSILPEPFMEILSRPPHCIKFIVAKQTNGATTNKLIMLPQEIKKKPSETRLDMYQKTQTLFSHSVADLNFALYGVNSNTHHKGP